MIKKRIIRFACDFGMLAVPSALLILIDSLVKRWAYTDLYEMGGAKDFINGFLGFRYAENTGAAWSILSDQPWIFMAISIIMILAIFIYLLFGKRRSNLLLRASLTMFFSGGVGNMIDRIFSTESHLGNRNGYVVDMLNFEFINFPVFNIADVCVCIGAGLFVLYFIIFEIIPDYKKDKKPIEEASSNEG